MTALKICGNKRDLPSQLGLQMAKVTRSQVKVNGGRLAGRGGRHAGHADGIRRRVNRITQERRGMRQQRMDEWTVELIAGRVGGGGWGINGGTRWL